MISKETKTFAINPEDELVKATMLTHGGQVVHPAFAAAPKAEAKAAEPKAAPAKKQAAPKAAAAAKAKPAAKKKG